MLKWRYFLLTDKTIPSHESPKSSSLDLSPKEKFSFTNMINNIIHASLLNLENISHKVQGNNKKLDFFFLSWKKLLN